MYHHGYQEELIIRQHEHCLSEIANIHNISKLHLGDQAIF